MPRGIPNTTTRGRRSTRARSDANSVVGQITQLVSANETLKCENAELLALNEQLRAAHRDRGRARRPDERQQAWASRRPWGCSAGHAGRRQAEADAQADHRP